MLLPATWMKSGPRAVTSMAAVVAARLIRCELLGVSLERQYTRRAIWNSRWMAMPQSHDLSSSAHAASDDVHADLVKKKCVPCEFKDLRPMSEDSANDLLQQVPGWKLEQDNGKLRLHRSWKAKSFLKGLEFFKLVADIAEAEGHHPDLHLVGYNNMSIDIWTHAVGGLTENDFILAAKIGALDASNLFRKPKI